MSEKKSNHWADYEFEVSHYFQHEPGPRSANLDPDRVGGYSSEPRPPQWAPGANHWMMVTVIDRLRESDKFMPLKNPIYDERGGRTYEGQPSCSMVLGAAYGTLACKYDDSAPGGAKWLAKAKEAYIKAAQVVAAAERPSAKDRLMRVWDRVFAK